MHVRRSFMAACIVLATTVAASAATNFVNLGVAAPPAMLGPMTMTPFDLAPQTAIGDLTVVSSIPGCPLPTPGSAMAVAAAIEKRSVGATWGSWSHGYAGPLYFNASGATTTLTLPPGANANAFYVYVEPNAFGLHEITVTTDTGGASGSVQVEGLAGATGFGFFTDAGEVINSIMISNPSGTALGFGIAEFGVGRGAGATCTINQPMMGAMVMDDVDIQFSVGHPMMLPVTATFEWSTDGGTTWSPATAAGTSPLPNPAPGLTTPSSGLIFTWDSFTDMVGRTSAQTTTFRITVNDGSSPPGTCTVILIVDNQAPLPSCTIAGPGGTASGNVLVSVDPDSVSSSMVDITLLYSTDGVTYNPCTMAVGSPSTNPANGVSLASRDFLWDSRGDGVALGGIQTVFLVAQIDDGVAPIVGECQTSQQVDNAMLCNGICGDCNLNGSGPDILDALTAAQIAAGLVTPQGRQAACCDVDATMSVTILDALRMAQAAAGLPVTLTCL